jgi:hypothetical protein
VDLRLNSEYLLKGLVEALLLSGGSGRVEMKKKRKPCKETGNGKQR